MPRHVLIAALLGVLSLGGARADEPRGYGGLSRAEQGLFDAGRVQFETPETVATGLGPVFNAESCAACHKQPTTGGSSATFVTRFGRFVAGAFDPMTEFGGPVVQANGIAAPGCRVPGEVPPPEAGVVTRRDTPPLFGLGLVDTVPDRDILRLADPSDHNSDHIHGRPNLVHNRVGRFGWKAQVVTLRQFVATAYLNEVGITSPDFPNELPPQGGPVVCDDVPGPEDDGTRIDAVTRFLLLLPPPTRGERRGAVRVGRAVFRRIGCERCHATRLHVGRTHPVAALRGHRIPLFSDLLLHDMGSRLADGIAQGFAGESDFRTAPLWGLRASAPYLHDGRAPTVARAILAHGGEAERAQANFRELSPAARSALMAFLDFI